MTALYNPLGFAQAKLIWTLTGDNEPMICAFGVENPDALSANDVASEVRAAWQNNVVAGALHTAYTFRGAEAQLGTATGAGGSVGSSVVAIVGSATGAPLPQNSTMLVHKRTALSGRKHRGRMYLPAGYLAEGSVSEIGGITAALVTSFQALLTGFLAALASSPNAVPMHVLHSDGTGILAPTLVNTLTLDPTIATQRQRLRR